MDVLSKVLRGVRLTGAFFFESIAYGEWAIVTPWLTEIAHVMPLHEHIISFHVVTEGACWVELYDGSVPPVRLKAGDVVVLPKGDEHVMASSRGLRATPNYSDFDIPPGRQLPLHSIVNEAAGGPVTCHFVCGFFGCDATPFNPLLEALPPIFRATTSPANRSLLALLADAGVEESEKNRTARDTKLARLAELMFVEVVRQHIDALPQESRGWLSAVKDRHVGRALQLIHAKPAEDWTLEGLARGVGLSRSVFAERFANLVGIPAAQYLSRWRLQLAAGYLEQSGTSIAGAAAEVGYESEAAFRRAFKKFVGASPAAWRRARLTASGQEPPPQILG